MTTHSVRLARNILFVTLLVGGIFSQASAAGFSGTGDGTSEATAYMITTCDQLQEMDNDLTSHYKLANDIDCAATNPSDAGNAASQWNDTHGFNPIGEIAFVGSNIYSGFNHQSFTGVFDGQNHKISNLYINRGANNGDLDGYYVGLFRTIAAGAEVKNVNLENVAITAAGNNVGALAGGLSGTVTNVHSSGTVHGQGNTGGLVGSHVDANNFPNSSPLVYTWNGSKYVYTDDVGGLLPKELSGVDVATIDSKDLAPKDGKYSMKISEEYNETVYYDKLALMTFDHAPGYSVVEPLARDAGVAGLRTVSDTPTNPLVSCVDEQGNNCLDNLRSYDDKWSYENKNGVYNPKNLKKSFILDFGALSNATDIQLVLRGARDYAASAQYPGNSARSISVKNADGQWVEIYNKNQIGSDGTPRLRTVDLTGKFLTNDYHVKVAFDTFNANYFAVDTSAQVPFTTHTYKPDSVGLDYHGFTAIDRTHFYDHDYSNTSPLPDGIFKNQYGKFTKYGDVTPLLDDADDHYVVMRYGDQLSVEFPYEAPAEGMVRSFALYNDALYKHATYQGLGEYGQSADYLPYHNMTKYGPGMAPYPMTAENISYINEWNTRVVPGPFADALRSGGSTVIQSYSTADVTGNYNVGGLVGLNYKEIRQSYFSGSVTGYGLVGGITGYNDTNGWVHDSYSVGTVHGTYIVGGIVGGNYGKIERTYAAGTVHNTGIYTGGAIGIDWSSDPYGIYNSFTVAEPTTDNNVIGGFIGVGNTEDYAAAGNYWFNAMTVGVDNSYQNPQPVKVANSDYFKTNHSSAPMNTWDFTTIWQTTANYPVLRFAPTEPEVSEQSLVLTLTEASPVPAEVTASNAVYNFSASSDIDTAFQSDTGTYIAEKPDCMKCQVQIDSVKHQVTFPGVQPGDVIDIHFGFRTTNQNSNLLHVGPFRVVADPVASSGQGKAWVPAPIVTPVKPVIDNTCPTDQLLTQNLKTGARNGKYNSYTKAVVTEAKILQTHMNRLGFSAGPVDGILGKLTDAAIKRMQKYLGTYQDGMVGPLTRGLINNSCGVNGLQKQ